MDYYFCLLSESYYKLLIEVIDFSLNFILDGLEVFKRGLNFFINSIYSLIINAYDSLVKYAKDCKEGLINKASDLLDRDLRKIRNDFCDSLIKCEFIFQNFLPENKNGKYYDQFKDEYVDGYTWFKRNVCTYGFDGYIEKLDNFLRGELNNSLSFLKGEWFYSTLDFINALEKRYMEYLKRPLDVITRGRFSKNSFGKERLIFTGIKKDVFDPTTANIFDLIKLLDLFANCSFSLCNLSVSVTNKREELLEKLKIYPEALDYDNPKNYLPSLRYNKKEMDMFKKLCEVRDFHKNFFDNNPCFEEQN